MDFYDPFDQGEPYACPFRLRVEFVEQSEDALVEFRGNTDPIIRYKKDVV